MRTISSSALIVALSAGLLAWPRATWADPAADAARHAEAGKKAFAAERFAEAIAEFRAANAIAPDPKLVYAIAQAQRMSGDCAGAIASYREFLASKPEATLAEYSRANISRCEKELAKRPRPAVEPEPATPEPATPEPATPEPATPVPVAPAPVVATPEPATPLVVPARRDRDEPSWTSDWMGHSLVGGGIAVAAVGAVLFVKGRSAAQEANDATDHESFLAARADAESALTYQRGGVGAAVIGAGLITWGVVHYMRDRTPDEPRITAVPLRGGAAVVIGGAL